MTDAPDPASGTASEAAPARPRRSKKSAGILLWRKGSGGLEVLVLFAREPEQEGVTPGGGGVELGCRGVVTEGWDRHDPPTVGASPGCEHLDFGPSLPAQGAHVA